MSHRPASTGPLKLLLVGPCPPPHGGISVHVATARRLLRAARVPCRVLDSGGHRVRGGGPAAAVSVARLLARVDGHARRGFVLHLHTNGHGIASWCVALGCAIAARRAPGRVLTLHSGLLPDFLGRGGLLARWLTRATLAHYERVICVHRRLCDALVLQGADRGRLAILPAHLTAALRPASPLEEVDRWMATRSPIVSAALSFRPEYGFDLLLQAMALLVVRHPRLGCIVMGGGEDEDAARRRVAELGLEDHVLLTGDLAHERCLAVIASSDVYARPSLVDGDAISVREALALGVPVVASDASPRPEGTRLHRCGDADDLAARLDELAGVERGARTAAVLEPGGLEALLWIYRQSRARAPDASGAGWRRLRARIARLRQMGAREIAWRVRHELLARADRVNPRARREVSDRALLRGLTGGPLAAEAAHGGAARPRRSTRLEAGGCASGDPVTGPKPGRRRAPPRAHDVLPEPSFKRYLSAVVAPRFYAPAGRGDRRRIAELLWRLFPTWLSAAAAEAERICAHRLEILGHGEYDLGEEIDWHRDPVSGTVWERRHFASFDPVRAQVDCKRICELNRHQHLPRLGKAYYLLGEERYAREVVAQMLGWIDQNPKGMGLHWHSSLEIAIRALSWLWALVFVLPSEALDESAARRIGKSLAAQLDHVARYPSVWSSPNTHLIGEATALYVGGLLFRDTPRGRRWLALGAGLLEREAQRQVLDDGLHAELSPYYHCYTIDFYLQALVLGRRSNRPLERRVWQRVEGLLDALVHLARPDGSLPLLGDDDGGRALALGSTRYADICDLLCVGGALFGRGDWKLPAGGFREEALWLLGREGWIAWEALPGGEPRQSRVIFRAGGYVVERSGWTRSSAHLVFDRGDLGKLGGGHGHADALSVVLHAHGEELLVDPGTYVYNGAPRWREFFRSTRAHNTVVVDGADQSIQADTFRWARRASPRALGEGSHEGIHWAAGEHDGYAPDGGVVHRRRVLGIENGYWLVLDDLRRAAGESSLDRRAGSRRHQLDVLWHFAPEAEVTLDPGRVEDAAGGVVTATVRTGAAGLTLLVHACRPVEGRTLRGATAPPQGWVSRRYGEKLAAPVLDARFYARAPATCITFLAPWRQGQRARHGADARAIPVKVEDTGRGGTAVALAIRHTRGEDLVILSAGDATVEAGPCRARAQALFLRIEEDRLARCLALGAEAVELRGVLVLESPSPVDHYWSASSRVSSVVAPYVVEEHNHVRHRRDR
ncbi:MAG TPA: heparinase II/III family protein [Thermoanaerobaculia bacterium]|nr:heparinase II/III family protein [Thermoanaerobaculia bacterium]